MNKILLHFVARNDSKSQLLDTLIGLTDEITAKDAKLRATLMSAHAEDPMRGTGYMEALPAAFDASLEILSEDTRFVDTAAPDIQGCALAELAHLDLSAALVGNNKMFVPCAPTPIRFQYCMRRRADYSDIEYLAYYEQHHVEFGLQMPGIEGYAQFHIDQEASASLASSIGFGVHNVSSVSELHIADMSTFFTAVAKGSGAGDAGQDEDKFVDRARSVMWLSDEVHRWTR